MWLQVWQELPQHRDKTENVSEEELPTHPELKDQAEDTAASYLTVQRHGQISHTLANKIL